MSTDSCSVQSGVVRRASQVLVGAFLVAFIGCGDQPRPVVEQVEPRYDLTEYRRFAQKVAGATSVVVYEGLPHWVWEGELLEEELAKSIHVTIDGYEFYEDGHELEGQEAMEALRLFTKEGNVRAWGGLKLCGGFHPDFMAEWTVGVDKYRAHACFGCSEVKAIGPGIDTLVDMVDGKSFEELLSRYQDKRPMPRDDG